MAIADQKTTTAEFEAFIARHPDGAFELVNGSIVEKATTPLRGIIAVNIGADIRLYLKSNPIGYAGISISHHMLDDNFNVRLPDISFRRVDNDDIVTEGAVPTMPDLAIEIKSPADSYTRMRDKAQYYLDNGTRLVWLVYPEKKFVEVYRKDADIDFLTIDDTLSGYDVLPDFTLSVGDIFP